ncbi:Gfo/Idh/MocA family protein [Gloeothece verrucosa]|uniref:Oxidoreductase domain protein n=1 Tax=Gloeothece verrucosa (strain PCC 7822) TaxID=497965 RepID=E0UK61_GLOV7|nr:Gfo/Idh/MocA family oxidoreductase [Gloeothece verrucosa]ADN15823.1 oxidoreductase domain protein [Gloeothece verrucosa PCC 7822]
MTIHIAILGVGRWGVHWVRNFLQHPDTQVIAIVDPFRERLTQCQKQFKLDEQQIILATEWETIRDLKTLDAVVVATPASSHYSLITDALHQGYHVLAEKPLTLNPDECRTLTELAKQQQRQLFIDHTYLFHPAVQQGQQIVKGGKLGELRYGYASRTHIGPIRQDVDALWDLAIHDIAIFNHWLGQTPNRVQARGKIWLQPEKGLADLVWVTLTYPDGFEASIHLCWLNPDKQRRLCLLGTEGNLIFDEMSPTPLIWQQGYVQPQGELFLPAGVSTSVIEVEKAEPLGRVCHEFIKAIQSQQTPSIASAQTATQLVEILSALTQSMQEQGKTITLK